MASNKPNTRAPHSRFASAFWRWAGRINGGDALMFAVLCIALYAFGKALGWWR